MSKKHKPKIAALVECPYCERTSHVLLKITETEQPKMKVVPCLHCERDMLVGYAISVKVEVSPMPGRQRPNNVGCGAVSQAFGRTWHHGALIEGGGDER